MNRKTLSRNISTMVKLAIAAGLIWWLVQRGTLDFTLLTRLVHPGYLAGCALALFLNLYINNLRWVVLMKGQGFQTGVKETLPLSFIGLFFNYAMPGGVGGDLVKGYYLIQDHPERKMAAATSILIDRIVGFVGMVVVSMLAIALNFDFILQKHELVSLSLGVLFLFLTFAAFFTLSFSSRLYGSRRVNRLFELIPAGPKIKKVYEAVHSYKKSPKEFIMALTLTLLTQIAGISFFTLAGSALGIDQVSVVTYMFVVPLGLIATALPISPAGIGVGQTVFMVLFNWSLGTESQLGPSLITAHQLLTFMLGLVGAFFYFKKKKPNLDKVDEVAV